MRAAIGSTNPIKIAATSVMRQIFGAGAGNVVVPVAGEVPAQPRGDVEARCGAIHRARAARLDAMDAQLGLGLEGAFRHVLTLALARSRNPRAYTDES